MIKRAVRRECFVGAAVAFALSMSVFLSESEAQPMGRVTIESYPPHAAVYVDDKVGGVKGYTPATLRVRTGTRKIILEAEGYKPLEQFITVKVRKTTVRFNLEKIPDTAKIHFIADAGILDAQITVNGEEKGTLKDDLEIPSGRHLVEITKSGYQKWSRWLELQQAEKRDLEIKLEKDLGDVKVIAMPSVKDAFVYINDENKGAAPWAGQLPPGTYKIDIKAPGFTALPQSVIIESGQKSEISIQMTDDSEKEKTGILSVAADPAVDEALVFIDGTNMGPAPWSGSVSSGHHKVEVRVPNYACGPKTIFVEGNKQNAITIQLYPIAKISASVNVDRAEVFIDDTSIGFTPLQDVDIPAKRSTIAIRKEGYKEYTEIVFPKKGETVTINTTLDYAAAKGMDNYLTLKFSFGLFGPTKLESDISGIDDNATTYNPKNTKMTVGLGFTHLFNSYIGLGLHAGFLYYGLGGDLALHVDPMLRFQIPIMRKGKRLVEFYLGAGVGFSSYFNKGAPGDDDVFEIGNNDETILTTGSVERSPTAFGWNVMTPLGMQFNVSNFIGIFIEASWAMHKTYGKLKDVPSGVDETYQFMWMEVAAAAGLAIIF